MWTAMRARWHRWIADDWHVVWLVVGVVAALLVLANWYGIVNVS